MIDRSLIAAALALALGARGAFAQSLPAVEVVAQPDDAAGIDAASEGIITREALERRPLQRAGEMLEGVPGLIATQHSGEGKANQLFLRGYNLDHGTDFATWVAGMPVNMPSHAHGQGYTDLNFVIPELVSGIAYRKGPYFAQEGDFASVGSARIAYAERLQDNIASLTAGAFNYRRALLAGSPAFGSGALVYGLEYQQSDGPWENPSGLAKYNGVLRYAQGTPASGWNITGMAYSADWNATDQIPRRAVDAGRLGRFGAVDPTDAGESRRYSLSGEWRDTGKETSRALSAYAIRSRLRLFSNFTYFLADPVNGDQFEQSEERLTLGGEASETRAGRFGERPMLTTYGVQLRRDRLSPVALYHTAARERLATTREDRVSVTSAAPYLSSTIEWTPWLRTVAGLRADFYRFEVASNLPGNSGTATDRLASPKLSAVFGPWARTEYFLNWGRGFHSNDARGTTLPTDSVSPLVRTTGYEAGVRTGAVPRVSATLALWRLDQDSELLFVGDAGTTEPSRPSRRTGVEALAQWQAAAWLALDFSVGLTRARFSDEDPAGNRIPGAPEAIASAGASVENLRGWFGALRWRYFGARPLVEDNSVRSSPTSLVNARIGYTFTKRTRVYADVFNLFNRAADDIDYYYRSRLPGEPAGGVNDVHFHPVEPRAVRATLALFF